MTIKNVLLFVAFCSCMAIMGHLSAESGDYTTLGYDTPNGYSLWRVDSDKHFKPGVASTLDIGTSALPVRNLYVGAITATGAVTFTGDVTASHYLVIPKMSSTTLATYVPAVGEVVFNSTRYAICVGTAATAGSLVFQSSNPITMSGVSCKE